VPVGVQVKKTAMKVDMLIRKKLTVIVGILILLVTIALIFICRPLMTVAVPLEKVDVIVLLAGSYEERAPLAISLYQTGKAGQILLTDDGVRRGWSREHQRNLFTMERAMIDLEKHGVPRHSIVMLPFRKSGTVYDAFAVRDYILKHNIHSILLVTSDYHTRRSLWTFRQVLQKLPVTIGIEPAASSVSLLSDTALEYIKFIYYLVRFGWVEDITVLES
jgi:uncharacterized SAM-binding protein YcdF (DUF218 family)